MALKDYIFNGSYTVLENFSYSKLNKLFTFRLVVYSDESKIETVAVKDMEIADRGILGIDYILVGTKPGGIEPGQIIITSDEIDGEWAEVFSPFSCVEYLGENTWRFHPLEPHTKFYDNATGGYFCVVDGKKVDISVPEDFRLWEPKAKEGNLISRLYSYLCENFEEFSGCSSV